MSYENAPATKLLATHCICCGRELLDAVSVDLGIGPVCREKHGYDIAVNEEARSAANKLVHEAAARAGQAAQTTEDLEFAIDAATKIEALGFSLLASKIRERFISIRLTETTKMVQAKTPYSGAFVDSLKRFVPYDARRWNKTEKVWEVAITHKVYLLKALADSFAGKPALGAKGFFYIPTPSEFETKWGGAK